MPDTTTKQPDRAPGLVIGVDADDTLWDNESAFADTEARFRSLVEPWVDGSAADARLIEVERNNLVHYGYGVKGFVLSMIEGAIALSGGTVGIDAITTIIEWGKELLTHDVALLPDVRATIETLAADHRVLIITKGDLHHQAARIKTSGLGDQVEAVEIVAEKDPSTYAEILNRHAIDPTAFVMIGNSVKSDVLPVIELGAQAIHIPFHVTWALEQPAVVGTPTWIEAASMSEVPALIAELETSLL